MCPLVPMWLLVLEGEAAPRGFGIPGDLWHGGRATFDRMTTVMLGTLSS
jgi:hypothetical protein